METSTQSPSENARRHVAEVKESSYKSMMGAGIAALVLSVIVTILLITTFMAHQV